MKTAVIGFGSIGARHARILQTISSSVSIVSRRSIDWNPVYADIRQLIEEQNPQYIVIANETSAHADTLLCLQQAAYKGKILIEKPILNDYSDIGSIDPGLTHQIYAAYNLRYHPVMTKLKELLRGQTVIQAQIYTGQYLPTWRPNTDYATSYSASKEKGGGVLRDLSHELDYLLWLFGDWKALVASGGKVSRLHIDSDDHFSAIFTMTSQAHITLHINYLDRIPRRQIIVNTDSATFYADFIKGTVQTQEEQWSFLSERDDTYRMQHLDCMQNTPQIASTFDEAIEIMRLIKMMEQSSDNREWISK